MKSPASRSVATVAVSLLLVACQHRAAQPGSTGTESTSDQTVDVVVLGTTDVHGWLRTWDYFRNEAAPNRGLTRAATIIDSVRKANPGRVVLLDAGDLLQGNPLAYVAARHTTDTLNPIVAAMNSLRYDAAAIGNHEYNYGVPYLERAVAQARFPFLSANTYGPGGGRAFRGWTIVEREGVKIGIIGATTPGVMIWDATNVAGRIRVGDIVPAVRTAVLEVRNAGADVVVVTMHSGLEGASSYDTAATGVPSENVAARVAREIPGIDLILFGHSHREVKELRIGSTLLVQPRNWATSVSAANLRLRRVGGRWRVASSSGDLIQSAGHAEHAGLLGITARAHERTLAYVNTVIGTTPVSWRGDSARLKDTPLIDFILEIQRRTAGADLASSAAFTLDASLDAGPITVAEIARLYPYDNTLRAVRITGRQLRDYLEFSARYYTGAPAMAGASPPTNPEIPGYNFDIVSGVEYILDLTKPAGSRVTALTRFSKPVRDTDTFTLALNNYRQTGGGGYSMLRGAPVVYDKQEELRQLLIDSVRARGTIRPEDFHSVNWRLDYPGAAGVGSHLPPAGGATDRGRAATRSGAGPGLPRGTPRLRIIATNDFHGALEPRADGSGVRRGGAAYLASAIERAKAECAPGCVTILLDGGDMFQGTPASNLAYGRPVVDIYNRLGYAAAALGNHEFDWGVDTLRARMRSARFAILGANVRFNDGRDVPWIRNDTLVTVGSLKVGIVGIASPLTPTVTKASNVAGLRFDDPAPIVDEHARSLRRRGANVVIVVAHEGAFCSNNGMEECRGELLQWAPRITQKVDAIVSGHTHSAVDYYVNDIPIVQARSSGRALGIVDIPLNGTRPSGPGVAELRDVVTATLKPLDAIDRVVRSATTAVAPLVTRPIARIAQAMPRQGNQYPLGNLIADAQRSAGNGDVAVMNNGGIRTGLRAGTVSYGDLFEMHPFGNVLYSVRMRGNQLREYLERLVGGESPRVHVSGLKIAYDPSRPPGSRIVSLRRASGRAFSDTATYDVVVNEFMLTTGDATSVPREGVSMRPLQITDLDALIQYLRTRPQPIEPPSDTRVSVVR